MKKVLIAFTLIIFVIIASLLSMPYWLDVNNYKPEIARIIKDKTGFVIKMDGKITARAVPDISLVIDDVSVQSSLNSDDDFFLSKKLVLNVKLAPLFNKKLEISSLKLIEPVIDLRVNKLGEKNWEQKTSGELPATSDEVTEVNYGAKKDTNLNDRFTLKELDISNALFKYSDEKSGQNVNVSGLNVRTSIIPGDNNFSFSGKLNIFEDEEKGVFSASGSYAIAGDIYKVQNLDLKLDEIKAKSDIEADLANARPSLKVSLYSNDININNYKIISASSGKDAEDTNVSLEEDVASNEWSSEKFDVAFLNEANVNFNFKASSIKYKNINIGETAVNTYLKDGRLTANFKDISLYEGVLNSEMVVDGASRLPAMKINFDIADINLKELLGQLANKDFVEGKANIKGDLYSVGNSEKAIMEKLSGKTGLSVGNGTITGVDLLSMVKSMPSAFKIGNTKNKTKFEQVTGDFDIKNGIVINENFVLKSDVANFEGRGEVNLPEQTIAYKLTPKYSQDFEKTDEPKPRIPILISGNLYNPSFRLELKTIVQDLINNPESGKNLVNQLKRDFKDIKGGIKGDDAGKMLKNLFQ